MSAPYDGQSSTESVPGISGESTAGGIGVVGTSGSVGTNVGIGVQAVNKGVGPGLSATSVTGAAVEGGSGGFSAAIFSNTGSGYGVQAGSALGVGLLAAGKTQAALFDGSVTVKGVGGTNVDLSVNGRIMSGDATNLGGLWVNSGQSMFVGAQGANNIGLYNGGWGLIMNSTGKVGVGTTSPYAQLSVGNGEPGAGKLAVFSPDNVYGQIQIGNSVSNGEAGIGFFQGATATSDGLSGGTAWAAGIGAYGNGTSFVIGNNVLNGPVLAIATTGKVGVGTTSPYAQLSVGNGEPGAGKLAVFSPDNVYGQIQIGNSVSNGEAGIGFFQGATVTSDGLSGGTAWAAGIGAYGNGTSFVIGNNVLNGPALTITTSGTISVAGDIFLTNADCAEEFDIATLAEVEPGTVMVLDQSGALQPSQYAYDKKVAGVISGAGEFRPGLILDKKGSSEGRMPVALLGKVYCKVDAQYAPVEVGDLLTSSPTPGHAMRAVDPSKAFGAIIGKALQSMSAGQKGLIPILVALQ
jgi:hypothetical protein